MPVDPNDIYPGVLLELCLVFINPLGREDYEYAMGRVIEAVHILTLGHRPEPMYRVKIVDGEYGGQATWVGLGEIEGVLQEEADDDLPHLA